MQFQFIPYIIPLSLSAIIMLGLALYGYKHRKVKGAKAFIINMLIGALWASGNALEMAGTNLSTKLFWANLQYIVYAFAPLAWLIMVLQFTDRSEWVNKRNVFLMSIIPIITIIFAWTDNIHGLVRSNFSLIERGSFSVIAKDYGIWFWIHFSYSYFLNFSTIFFLFRTVWRKNTIYRKQAFYLLSGFSVLMISNFLYVTGLSPISEIDLSPISISISGLIIAWGIFHFQLFNIVPVARATVMEKMGSGIIVIDKMNRIIDINPEARNMLTDESDINYYGKVLSSLSGNLQSLVNMSQEKGITQKEFLFKENQDEYYYEVFISTIEDYRKEEVARVLIINDITDLKEAREQINKQKQQLAVKDERERMARDLHDNLGQVLSFSNVQIQAIRQEIKNGNYEQGDQYLKRLNQIIKKAHKDIREYVYNIRDNQYYQKKYSTLLKKEVNKFEENFNFNVNLNIKEKLPTFLGIEEKIQLVFILKESLTNILKHANTKNVFINLKNNNNSFKMEINDKGKGFDESSSGKGSGLSIMEERINLIGGNFKISSKKNQGTSIVVELK